LNDEDDSNYSEFSYGKFLRSFNLPDNIKEKSIKASMKDGVLAIQVPRLEKVKPEVKKIAIK
jgi:HSP20 family protein